MASTRGNCRACWTLLVDGLGIIPVVPTVVPEVVRSAIVRVCRDAFYYKDDVKALFVASGTPQHVWERHAGEGISKAKTVRMVLSELVSMGEGGAQVQARVADELARRTDPSRALLIRRPAPRRWTTFVGSGKGATAFRPRQGRRETSP